MNKFVYTPSGVCSSSIILWIEQDRIQKAEFEGGCEGNLQGICRLIEGMPVEEVIRRIKGIGCGPNLTSCPDQLARGLEVYLSEPQNRSNSCTST